MTFAVFALMSLVVVGAASVFVARTLIRPLKRAIDLVDAEAQNAHEVARSVSLAAKELTDAMNRQAAAIQ